MNSLISNAIRRFVRWQMSRSRIDWVFTLAITMLGCISLEIFSTVPTPWNVLGVGGLTMGIIVLISIFPVVATRWHIFHHRSRLGFPSGEITGAPQPTPHEPVNATVDLKHETNPTLAKNESPVERYLFCKRGEVWTLAFREGKSFQIKDMKGLTHIAILLRQPNHGFHILELVRFADPAIFDNLQCQVRARSIQELATEEGLNIKKGESGMEVYDAETRENLNKRLKEIEKTLEHTEDPAQQAELEKEATQIQEYLNEGKGKGGKIRTKGEMAEKERTRVAHLVDGAIDKISRYDSALATHLRECVSIKTGDSRYLPPRPVSWQI